MTATSVVPRALGDEWLPPATVARASTRELGDDPPEVRDWVWPG